MPLSLDETDVSILNSISEDGRKSFRQISSETGITTPTVKSRYERLVNVGFIKGVLPVFDFEKIESGEGEKNFIQLQSLKENVRKKRKNIHKSNQNSTLKEEIQKKISSGLAINIVCDFCEGPVHGKPKILKFANIERFFCCISCKSGYSQKYRGRIESIIKRYDGKSEMDGYMISILFLIDLIQYPYFDGFCSTCCLQAAEHKYTLLPLISDTCFAVFSSTFILQTGSFAINTLLHTNIFNNLPLQM